MVQTAPNQVDVDEFNRWAAPLNDAVAQVVAGDLVKLLGTPNVASAPMANFEPAYRVTIDIQRFDSAPGQAATAVVSRATLYERVKAGEIKTQKDGRRSYITVKELQRYVADKG